MAWALGAGRSLTPAVANIFICAGISGNLEASGGGTEITGAWGRGLSSGPACGKRSWLAGGYSLTHPLGPSKGFNLPLAQLLGYAKKTEAKSQNKTKNLDFRLEKGLCTSLCSLAPRCCDKRPKDRVAWG